MRRVQAKGKLSNSLRTFAGPAEASRVSWADRTERSVFEKRHSRGIQTNGRRSRDVVAQEFRVLFGDENAERDPLLTECAVLTKRAASTKPILTGKWGTGKTALLLLQNQTLSDRLKKINPDLERMWYLDEST